MAGPIQPFSQQTSAFRATVPIAPPLPVDPLSRLIENIARLVDRMYPPTSDGVPPALSGAAARLRAQLSVGPDPAANLAVLTLKALLQEVDGLRERAAYLDGASSKAYAELSTAEETLRERGEQLSRLWQILSELPWIDARLKRIIADELAEPTQRLLAAEEALHGGPAAAPVSPSDEAATGDLAGQLAKLRAKAAQLRSEHGTEARRRGEVIGGELVTVRSDLIAAQTRIGILEAQVSAVQAERDALRDQLGAAQRQHDDANALRERLVAQEREQVSAQERTREATTVRRRYETLASEASLLRDECRDLRAQVAVLDGELAGARTGAAQTSPQLEAIRHERDAAVQAHEAGEARLAALAGELHAVRTQSARELELAGARVVAAEDAQREATERAETAAADAERRRLIAERERDAARAEAAATQVGSRAAGEQASAAQHRTLSAEADLATARRTAVAAEQALQTAILAHQQAQASHAALAAQICTAAGLPAETGGETALLALATRAVEAESDAGSTQSALAEARIRLATLDAEAAQGRRDAATAAAALAAAETTSRAAVQQAASFARDREAAQAETAALTAALAESRSQLAAVGADLTARETALAEAEHRLAAAAVIGERLTASEATLNEAQTRAAEAAAVVARIFSAVKELGTACDGAADRVGVSAPALTRMTTRISRAEQGDDLASAAGYARELCQRAAAQAKALANALNETRAEHRAAEAAHAAAEQARQQVADTLAAERRLAGEIAAGSEQAARLLQAQLTSASEAQTAQAAEHVHVQRRLEQQLKALRGEVEEQRARADAASAEAEQAGASVASRLQAVERAAQAASERAEDAEDALAAAQAAAAAQSADLTAALDARDADLSTLREEIARIRAVAEGTPAQQLRLAALATQLAAAESELVQVRGERALVAEQAQRLAELEAGASSAAQAREAALVALTAAEQALGGERVRSEASLRTAERRTREASRRLDLLHEDLSNERNAAAAAAAEAARLRGELTARRRSPPPTASKE